MTFKASTGITDDELRGQLMDTTSEKLRYAMFQDDRDIKTKEEATLLTSIKRLAVKVENVMVSRIMLHSLQQEADEGIRNFTAHIKCQAELCSLVVACTCNANIQYTDPIVRDIIIFGLHDQDHQDEILGHPDQDMSVDNILTLLETKETGQKTQASILGETGGAGHSSYKSSNPWQAATKVRKVKLLQQDWARCQWECLGECRQQE
jgi:hypothetical protein